MARYRIAEEPTGIEIELTGVRGDQGALLDAFEECQSGRCTCPTDEYRKVAGMDVASKDEEITLRLRSKPGERFLVSEISASLDHTISKVERT